MFAGADDGHIRLEGDAWCVHAMFWRLLEIREWSNGYSVMVVDAVGSP